METYTATQTTAAAEYVSAIVAEMRAAAIAKQAQAEQEERERAAMVEERKAAALANARDKLPAALHPFISVVMDDTCARRLIVALPGIAPFAARFSIYSNGAADLDEGYFYPALVSIDDSGEYAPALEISRQITRSTLEKEVARAYEAQRVYDEARAQWEHAEQERKHSDGMSERESKLRHDEEPEPPAEPDDFSLSGMTDWNILYMAETNIKLMHSLEVDAHDAEDYYRRAMALCAYVQARNASHSRREVAF